VSSALETCLVKKYRFSEFGLGKNIMCTIIEEEAAEAIERLKLYDGQDLLVDQNFNVPIFNILWRIAASRRYNVSSVFLVFRLKKCRVSKDMFLLCLGNAARHWNRSPCVTIIVP
jgi:hypothetical protein